MIKITQSYPLFVTDKLETLKQFYEDQFGFTSVFFEQDFYLHLVHTESQNQLGFLVPNHPSQPSFLHAASDNIGNILTLEVDNAQEAFETAKKNKLELMLEYTKETWGQKHFIIKDPAGLLIDIVEDNNQ